MKRDALCVIVRGIVASRLLAAVVMVTSDCV
jgi:hypothetical protein